MKKQSKRFLIIAYLWVALILIALTSCRTKKVSIDIQKSSDKTKIEEKSEVKTKVETKTEDKSKVTETKNNNSKITEKQTTTITADSIIQDKDGSLVFKGNVEFKSEKQVDSNLNKKSVLETLKDLSTDSKELKEELNEKTEQRDIKEFKKKKSTEILSFPWIAIAIPVCILLLLAFIAVRWNWLKRLVGL